MQNLRVLIFVALSCVAQAASIRGGLSYTSSFSYSFSYVFVTDASCFLSECGCPVFNKTGDNSNSYNTTWCQDANALEPSTWCQESEEQCTMNCGGAWCLSNITSDVLLLTTPPTASPAAPEPSALPTFRPTTAAPALLEPTRGPPSPLLEPTSKPTSAAPPPLPAPTIQRTSTPTPVLTSSPELPTAGARLYTVDWQLQPYEPVEVAPGNLIEFVFFPGHDVWLMPDEIAFEACDFSQAIELGRSSPVSYLMDPTLPGRRTSYFACSPHCRFGQKIQFDAAL